MKLYTCLLILSLPVLHIKAQEKMPLKFQSYARKLCASPDGGMVITTKGGEVAITDSLNGYWRMVPPENGSRLGGPMIEQGDFFNKDTGFVSGWIDNNGEHNIIYHTRNGGQSWKAVNYGVDGWVDDACHLDNGEAWLSVGGKGIFYTTDYGLSWKRLSNPEQNQRFACIYFNTKREGLIGSLWNMLALTLDNCTYWKIIPTPLDQKKYNKTNVQSRPEINRTAIFNNYLLVNQEGLIFYTKRDTISWVPLPDYTDFYTDATNSALFFKLKTGGFIRADHAFKPLFRSDIDARYLDVSCRHGKLFVMTQNEVIQLLPDNTVRSSFINTNRDADVEPEDIGFKLGAIGNNIYTQKEYGEQWEYVLTLPFKTDSGYLESLKDNKILYHKGRDSLYYYNIATNRVEKKELRKMISSFWEPGIKKITYSRGSQGCDHSYRDELVYSRDKGDFRLSHSNPKGRKYVNLQTDIEEIAGTAVSDFVKSLPDLYNKYPNIQSLGFTEADYRKCKRDIIKFKDNPGTYGISQKEGGFYLYENNIDFDRLLSTVDTIKQLNDSSLSQVLANMNEMLSTTTNWVSLTIVNRDNSTMTIVNSGAEANALYFPWRLTIDGASTTMYAMPITNFIRETCPMLLSETNRVKVLHTFVRRLYK
jgi:photosystem II stability/assembly factor-like uncharacterized protein